MKYILQWNEEASSYADLNSALLNYGPVAFKVFGHGVKKVAICGKSGFYAKLFIPEDELKIVAKEGYKFFMNRKKLNFLIDFIETSKKELDTQIRNLVNLDLKKMSNNEFCDLCIFFGMKLGRVFVGYVAHQPHHFTLIEKELSEYLTKKIGNDIAKTVSILTTEKNQFKFLKNNHPLLKTFGETIGNPNYKIDREAVNKKFYVEKKSDESERNNLIKKLKLPKNIIYICDLFRTLAEERLKCRFSWMYGLYYNELLTREICRRCKISADVLKFYEYAETGDLIIHNKRLSTDEIKKRSKPVVKILEDNDIIALFEEKAQKFLDEISKDHNKSTELVGTIASKGHIVGRVINFSYIYPNHSKRIKKMMHGDVVITEMTKPNIVPACEKAGAIVTNEGGMLSHAAIISRELGVPCILGTVIATEIFKDGDYIEVDANKGIVRKLTKIEYEKKKKELESKKEKEFENESKKKSKKIKMNHIKKGNIHWFKDLTKYDLPTVGGKGANLGELYEFNDVPNGFCVSVTCYEKFLQENKLANKIKDLLKGVNLEDSEKLSKAATKIRALIMSKSLSKDLIKEIKASFKELGAKSVAVRSSATAEDLPTASFAGQQDTYLNISGADEVIIAVKKCWASLFTDRAIYYREKNKFKHEDVLISVVIQEMVEAKYAGVMFTKDPIEKKDIMIEIVKGLGEKLVSGEVTPNSYLIKKNIYEILTKKEKFNFNENLIKQIAKQGKHIEIHYGAPQDIEFAIDKNNKLWILQSRAITTL